MLYLVVTTRHESIFGNNFALFWGFNESEGGYNSDARTAHRFTEKEALKFTDNSDIPIPIDKLGLTDECEKDNNINLLCLVEKATLNRLYNLNLHKFEESNDFEDEEDE